MNVCKQLVVRERPISLLVVTLLCVAGVLATISAGATLYHMATEPLGDAGTAALAAVVGVAQCVLWPFVVYKAVAARRRKLPL
jgi:uncharacterized membrane protein